MLVVVMVVVWVVGVISVGGGYDAHGEFVYLIYLYAFINIKIVVSQATSKGFVS